MEKRQGRAFYLDTYALMEILQGNPNYEKYGDAPGVTSIMNLYEMYYQLLRIAGKEVASVQFKKFKSITVEIDEEHIVLASKTKLKRSMSYVDALGYAIAQSEGIPFLTGDSDFESLENVEFVK